MIVSQKGILSQLSRFLLLQNRVKVDLSNLRDGPFRDCDGASSCIMFDNTFINLNEKAFQTWGTSLTPINISHNHFENCTSQTIDISQRVQTSIFLGHNVWINCTHSGYNGQILYISCSGYGTTIQHQDSIRTVSNPQRMYLAKVYDESSISSTNVSDISLPVSSCLCLAPGGGQSASQKFMIYSRLKASGDVIVFLPLYDSSKYNASSSNFVELDAGGYHFCTQWILTIIEDSFISLKEGQDSIKCDVFGGGEGFLFQNCCLEKPISSGGIVQIENSKDFSKCTMIPVPPEKKPEQFSFHVNVAIRKFRFQFLIFFAFSSGTSLTH